MMFSSAAFALGVLLLQRQVTLPDAGAFAWLGAAGLMLLLGGRRLRLLVPVAAFVLGFAWAGWRAAERLGESLAAEREGSDIAVVGVVAEMPQRFDNGIRFDFAVEAAPPGVPPLISLAWYRGFRRGEDDDRHAAPEVRAGERWRLTVRLKRPHGNINPHGFDFEAWLFERGVRSAGYVRPAPDNLRLDEFVARPGYAVERLRQVLRERFDAALPGRPYAGILVALAIGDQGAIDADLWRVFAQTGLTHLMSISGLHVTMVAALLYALVGWLWRRSPRLPLLLPAQQAAAVGGVLGALAYCLLAGYAVPAQRTLYMLGAAALALWSRRNVGVATMLAFALIVVLLIDPWAVLSAGFWLSFGAVGLLFFMAAGRIARPHWLREWAAAQWAVTVGMIPALLALFQQFSLVSPLANALAIPAVSLAVTPLALAACILPAPLYPWLLELAHGITALLMAWVEWLATLPWAVWQQHAPPDWTLLPALAGVAWLLLPRGMPARWVGGILLLPLVLVPPPRPAAGEAEVVVLDVGQGLAVHVRTASHDLLYDTGPSYSPEANSGSRIIVPYLRAAGVHRLDALVVTHQDSDHSGGAASVLEALPVERMLDSLPFENDLAAAPVAHTACSDGQHWEWDGVAFVMLHPPASHYAAPPAKTNDMSCVLKVTAAGRSVLLTSDIEALSEGRLLAAHRSELRSDVLLVPHHGSRTSSTPAFVAAVGAPLAAIPVGYRNRFRHPRPDVLARYTGPGRTVLRTDEDGAVTLRLSAAGIASARERLLQDRYWRGR